MAREYGPIFRLTMPGGDPRVIVSGADLVEEICDDTRFDKQVGAGLQSATGRPHHRGGLFTSDTADPLLASRPQHPDGAVQPAGDARVHAADAGHRGTA